MRDKVKRFISILMTALMLVNLMPVGALADGITSGGYQQATVASTTYGAWVYVYAKLTGTVPGTTENAHGWYTLGKKWVDNMPDPSGEEMGALYGYGEISGVSVNSVINGMQKYTANENITASAYDSSVSGSGEFGFKICDGATDYVLNNNIKTWHLNLQIDVAKIQGKYTFHFKDQQGNKIKDSVTVTGKWNTEGSYTAPTKINYNGYVYKLTGAATKSYTFNTYQQEHTFYYYNTGERVPYTLKIYYYYESVSDVNLISKDVLSENPYTEDNIKYGGFYSVTSPTIIGYKPDKLVVDGWMPSHDVTVNVIYTRKNDLRYTVKYLETGTNKKLRNAKTVENQPLHKLVTEEAPDIEGYKLVSESPKSITIIEGTNEIIFYYEKDTFTIKYRKGDHAADTFTEQEYTAKYDDPTPTFTGNKDGQPGWKFDGWTPEVAETVKGTATYTAQWVPDTKQNVEVIYTTDGNGKLDKSFDPVTQHVQIVTGKVVKADGSVIGDDLTTVRANAPSAGYEFDHWVKVIDENNLQRIDAGSDLTNAQARPLLNQEDGLYQETVFKAIFRPRTDLSYTVNYYWNGTTTKVADSKTITGKMFGEEVTESPIGADGYTPVSNDPKKITIGTGNNEITFYYYKNVELTANSKTETYDGTQKSVSGFTGAPNGVTFVGITEPSAAGTDVGTYWAEFEKDKDKPGYPLNKVDTTGKYIVTAANPGTLTINPIAEVVVKIAGNTKTETYNGNPYSVEGYTVTSISNTLYTEDDFEFSGEAKATGTNAGTYPMNLEAKQFNNTNTNFSKVTFVVEDGKLVIDPIAEVVVNIKGNTKTETYNGNPYSVEGYTVTSISNTLYTEDDFEFSGEAKATGTNAGTYPMNLEAKQFSNTSKNFSKVTFVVEDGWLKIDPIDEVTVTITGHKDTQTYDGNSHTVTGYDVAISNEKYKATDFRFNGKNSVTQTNAGTYPMGLKAADFENTNTNFTNVTFKVTDGSLTISPRSVVLTSETASKPYDGTALTKPVVKIEGSFVEGEVSDVKATGSVTNVSEGEVTNTITYTEGDNFKASNYNIEKGEGKLSISKRSVTLTSATLIKDFDGTPLTNGDAPVKEEFGTEKAFPDGEGVTYTFTGSQTNAGSSKNMFTYAWNEGTKADNYTICPIEGDLVVTPIDGIKVTITGRKDTQTYDGKPHKVEGYDVKPDNPLFTEKDIKFNGEAEATGTDVRIDPYQMGLKPEQFTNTSNNFTNVEFVVEDGQIVITPRPVTLTSETAGKTYDGTALEKPVVTVGGDGFVEGQVTEIKATGSVTNAGSVANTITFMPNKETFKEGNYAITKAEGTLTIAKRSVLITSQSATKTYDGSALTRPAVTITGDGFVPGELAKAEATGSITKVGSTPNAIQYTTTGAFNAANYSIALSVGTLTVTEKPKPEPRRTFNLTINYVYQNGKRAAASYNRGGLKNGETFDITSPVIAGYTASETVVSGTIYNRDIKVTVIYTADGVNLDDYGVPLGLGNITMNVGDCFE